MDIILVMAMVVATALLAVAILQARAALIARGRAEQLRRDVEHLEADLAGYHEARDARARAESRATELEKQLAEYKDMLKQVEYARDMAQKEANTAQRQVEAARQQLVEQEKRIADWEKTRDEMLTHTKASILEAGGQMSSKLLEDFKREAEEKKKENEEVARKASASVMEQYEKITNSFAQLQAKTEEFGKHTMTMWKALSSPGGAGRNAEIILENTLRQMGLEEGRDFFTQFSADGGLRPDAVIRLPHGRVLVVDCKASKHLFEHAEAEGETEQRVLQQLAHRMHEHVKELTGKGYLNAVREHFRRSNIFEDVSDAVLVMYVPHESLVEKLRMTDPAIFHKMEQAGLILASPLSLSAICTVVSSDIRAQQREKGQERILQEVERLMDNLVVLIGHVEKVGRGIKQASTGFNDLARSVNGTALPKLKRLQELGMAGKKKLPALIATYDMQEVSQTLVLEAESADEEFDENKLLQYGSKVGHA